MWVDKCFTGSLYLLVNHVSPTGSSFTWTLKQYQQGTDCLVTLLESNNSASLDVRNSEQNFTIA